MWKFCKEKGAKIVAGASAVVGGVTLTCYNAFAAAPVPVGVDADFDISTTTLGIVMGAAVTVLVGILVYRKIVKTVNKS